MEQGYSDILQGTNKEMASASESWLTEENISSLLTLVPRSGVQGQAELSSVGGPDYRLFLPFTLPQKTQFVPPVISPRGKWAGADWKNGLGASIPPWLESSPHQTHCSWNCQRGSVHFLHGRKKCFCTTFRPVPSQRPLGPRKPAGLHVSVLYLVAVLWKPSPLFLCSPLLFLHPRMSNPICFAAVTALYF